jgi:hypothetical protein
VLKGCERGRFGVDFVCVFMCLEGRGMNGFLLVERKFGMDGIFMFEVFGACAKFAIGLEFGVFVREERDGLFWKRKVGRVFCLCWMQSVVDLLVFEVCVSMNVFFVKYVHF